MDNPFRDGGPLDRATPWLSAALAVLLAANAVTGGASPAVGMLSLVAAALVVGRASHIIIRRDRAGHRSRRGR